MPTVCLSNRYLIYIHPYLDLSPFARIAEKNGLTRNGMTTKMPRVVIEFDPEEGRYDVFRVTDTWPTIDHEYAVLVDMKASHYNNIKRNEDRVNRDQEFLEKFFIEAQALGRPIRER
jgi:hypothetical protein